MPRSVFITATDTNAGKTWLTAALTRQCLKAGVAVQALKPIASGLLPTGVNEDVQLLLAAQPQLDSADINFKTYAQPVAPALAANLACSPLVKDELLVWLGVKEALADVTLIEGVGGLMVPLVAEEGGEPWLVNDWLNAMPDVEVLLVAPLRLGCINHILLSCFLLAQSNRAPKWIVLNDMYDAGTAEETKQMLQPFLMKMFAQAPQMICLEKDGEPEGIW